MLLHLGQSPTLVVSSAELVKELTKSHDIAFSDRPNSTASDALLYEGKGIAFSRYNEHWRQARKVGTLQLLSQKRVQSFHSVRDEEVRNLVATLRAACLSSLSVDLTRLVMSTSNDIITRCVIGKRFSDGGPGNVMLGDLAKVMTAQMVAVCVGDLFPCLRWIDWLRGFTFRLRSTADLADSFYTHVIDEHHNKGVDDDESRSMDFVDILLQLQKGHEFDLTPVHVKAILQDMLLAGVDTTSTTIEWLMAELVKHPRVMKKAQEEVRRVAGAKNREGQFEDEDLNQMNYLKCVIKETLRLHPPFPLLLPRETSKSISIGGYNVPANTKVLINAWAIQRHPSSWDNSDEFIPERFENIPFDLKSQDFALVPFGFGRRQCPGVAFGTVNIEYIVSNLLYFFDWRMSNNEPIDMAEINGIVVRKKLPLHLVPKPCFA